jgi:hypothetical protein
MKTSNFDQSRTLEYSFRFHAEHHEKALAWVNKNSSRMTKLHRWATLLENKNEMEFLADFLETINPEPTGEKYEQGAEEAQTYLSALTEQQLRLYYAINQKNMLTAINIKYPTKE